MVGQLSSAIDYTQIRPLFQTPEGYIPTGAGSLMWWQQQCAPCPPFACIGHLFPEQHIFPFGTFPFSAIIGHLGPEAPPDIMGHFPSLQQPLQPVPDSLCGLFWLQQAQIFPF